MVESQLQQSTTIAQRLTEEAQRLRKQAQGTPPGIERDSLLRRARQAEMAHGWLSSKVA
jgi:hypothetical protein